MSHSEPYISIKQLSVKVDEQLLLDAVDLNIQQGERIAILGANGAGKTTLLRCLLGLIQPESGQVVLESKNINTLPRREMARKIAYVPQGLNAETSFSVQDFILMSRYSHPSHGLISKDNTGMEIAYSMMQRAGIEHLAQRSLSTLSGGERQKVSIAAALTQQTPILILDEPAAHLDPKQQESIQSLLESIHQSANHTIITVTHDLNWAASYFDRLVGLKKGNLMVDGTPKDFMTSENLATLFDANWEIHPHPHTGKPMVIR